MQLCSTLEGGGGGGKEKEIPGLEEKKLEGSNAILAHLLHFFFLCLFNAHPEAFDFCFLYYFFFFALSFLFFFFLLLFTLIPPLLLFSPIRRLC